MRLVNLAGRLGLVTAAGAVDVASASKGRFAADPQAVYDDWDLFLEWASGLEADGLPVECVDEARLGPVVPRPRQVFAVGANYVDHADEIGFVRPTVPMIFTKFPSCIAAPTGTILLPDGDVDYEVELVAVIGRESRDVDERDAWQHVAGVTVGQDLSERTRQMSGSPPQFSLAKSFPGFGPIGPALVTVDEVLDVLATAELTTMINGVEFQRGAVGDMVFSVPALIAHLSGVCTLYPGDLIFTGTPPGVGMARRPPRYLTDGDELVSSVEGIGTMRHTLRRNTDIS